MSERQSPCARTSCDSTENVCIQTKKIYDSCRDKECIENLKVYLTESGQCLLDRAVNVKARKAEIVWIYSDVEPVSFNRGYYSIDLRFYFKITLDIYTGLGRPTTVEGIAVYDKKVILFGSEGNAKTFSSKYRPGTNDIGCWQKNNLPVAQTDVCDSICFLNKKHYGFLSKITTLNYGICLTIQLKKYKMYMYDFIYWLIV